MPELLLIAIEIKASATATATDFKGLSFLRDKLGTKLKAGLVLYTGADSLPFGDRLAVPVPALWTN